MSNGNKPIARRALSAELVADLTVTLNEATDEARAVRDAFTNGSVTTDDVVQAKALRVDGDRVAGLLSKLFTPTPPPGSVRAPSREQQEAVAFVGAHWLCSTGWAYEQGIGWRRPDGSLVSGVGDVWSALDDALATAGTSNYLTAAENKEKSMDTKPKTKSMTLRQVCDELGHLLASGTDPDMEVITEGCDCDGDVGTVEVAPVNEQFPKSSPKVVKLRRS